MLSGHYTHRRTLRDCTPALAAKLLGSLLRIAVLVAVLLCAWAPAAYAQGSKFAVIDLRRAVIETEDGLRVQSKLKQLFDSRQTELDGRQKAFQEGKAKLEKQAKQGKLSKQELQKRYDSLQGQATELQGMLVEYQREMQRQENELTSPIVSRMMTLIRRVASQQSYDMVLDRSAVPYVRSDLDITDRLIQMYNAGEGQSDTKPKPSKKAPKKRR
ncbi:MAG: OmpH family outer membrane protein [Deltaproteobacteria bacterium]|jgi:outer membrane protein|nr:OmpH family outer membrane protein [Deltaproteobacteria bacterium]MBW2533583.1 OmpH family outer membrane protein [Deltaproteobacteria bacterium]